jgi:hypothetical protein
MSKTKFELGEVVATPGALEALNESGQNPISFLMRHQQGDWGNLDDFDRQQNEAALKDGSRLLSAYETDKKETIWIITEAVSDNGKRSHTTILLPEDY